MFLIRLKTFIKSLFWHVAYGLPKSSQKTINNRWNICLNCEEGFDAINSQCTICGCNLSNKRVFLNKLAWADQECPLKKWNKTLK